MKKKNKLGLVGQVKRLIKFLVAEDIRTEGKITSAIIAAMCFLAMVLIVIICAWFKLG